MEPGRKVDAGSITTHTGGGAINAAVSLKRQGYDVSSLVKIGKDLNGEKLLEQLGQEGISRDLVREHDTELTAVSVIISSHDNNAAIFTHRGANCCLTDDDVHHDFFIDVELVYVTNLSNDSADRFPVIVQRAKKAGAFIATNPGIRQLTTRTEPFFDSLKHVDFFVCNFDEACALVPSLVDRTGWEKGSSARADIKQPALRMDGFVLALEDFAQRLHGLGPAHVAITNGTGGAYLSSNGSMHHQPIFPVEVMSTVGAGDAFASTVAGGLVSGMAPEKVMNLAARNASSVIRHVDAQTGLLAIEELNRLRNAAT